MSTRSQLATSFLRSCPGGSLTLFQETGLALLQAPAFQTIEPAYQRDEKANLAFNCYKQSASEKALVLRDPGTGKSGNETIALQFSPDLPSDENPGFNGKAQLTVPLWIGGAELA